MKLIKPDKKYEKSWKKAVVEFKNDSKTIKLWEVLGSPDNLEEIIHKAKLHSRGKELPDGWVPYDIFWLVDGEEIIGITSVRHELNDFLKKFGGHIGYEIVPSKRELGHGNRILRLSLEKLKSIGVNKVLVTSFDKNIASWKIIEKKGGKLENKIQGENEKDITRRYWVEF